MNKKGLYSYLLRDLYNTVTTSKHTDRKCLFECIGLTKTLCNRKKLSTNLSSVHNFSQQIISCEFCSVSANRSYAFWTHKLVHFHFHRLQTGWHLMWAVDCQLWTWWQMKFIVCFCFEGDQSTESSLWQICGCQWTGKFGEGVQTLAFQTQKNNNGLIGPVTAHWKHRAQSQWTEETRVGEIYSLLVIPVRMCRIVD